MQPEQRTFEVEQAGCPSCAARVREALAPLATVHGVEIDADADTATVRLDDGAKISEQAVNRALREFSEGSGHSYRVKPGSWRLET
jgi:copper chaperone CopZ